MKERKIVPISPAAEKSMHTYDRSTHSVPHVAILEVHGHTLFGHEIGEFLFSGNVYSLPGLEDEIVNEIHFIVPEARQKGLYTEVAALRKRQPAKTVFTLEKDSSRHIREIVACSQAENAQELYVAKATVRRGKRITDVVYGYFERTSDAPSISHPASVVPIEALRQRRIGATPQPPTLMM